MSNEIVSIKNNHDFMDYKQPVNFKDQDMRTSYYRGHNKFYVVEKNDSKRNENVSEYLKRKGMIPDYTSEKSHQYQWKYPEYNESALKAPDNRRSQFINEISQCFIANPPKPIEQYNTQNRIDYIPQPNYTEEKFDLDFKSKEPEILKEHIYANTFGAYKYLDIYMTTNMQDFILHKEKDQSLAKNDHITVWDWLEYPKTKKGYGLKQYPIKKKDFIEPMNNRMTFNKSIKDHVLSKKSKFVPSGLTTEMQANYKYIKPIKFEIDFDEINPLIVPETGLKTGTTEQKFYGSGSKTHTVINSRGKCTEKLQL